MVDERLFLLAIKVLDSRGFPHTSEGSSSKICEKIPFFFSLPSYAYTSPFWRRIYSVATYRTAKMLMCSVFAPPSNKDSDIFPASYLRSGKHS